MRGKMRPDLYSELYEVENCHWWHQHKRAVVHEMIDKYAKKGKVLDVGSGTGKILEELKAKGWEIRGVDGADEAVRWSRKREIAVEKVDFNKQSLPFPSGDFDLVLALDILEHLPKDRELLLEIKRVLKPGGVFIVTVPAYQWLFGYWDKMLGHKRRYNRKRLLVKFTDLRFKVVFNSYYFCLHLFPALLVRLFKSRQNTERSDFQTTPIPSVSLPVIKIYDFLENFWLKFFSSPFGLSLIYVARKL